MSKKILRLGFTEMSLLFVFWYQNSCNIKNEDTNKKIIDLKKLMIKWFYTTSGYYDKTIISNYMDAKHDENNDPYVYNEYFKKLFDFIKNADSFTFGIHYDKNLKEFKDFMLELNVKQSHSSEIFFSTIKNKKILIISPFAELFKIQYESGNCHKIHNNFPTIDKIYYYTNIYTFFNKGPHNNILETINFIYNDINNTILNDYDLVIISAGAYSNILAIKFYEKNKDVYTLGAELQNFFGILNGRTKEWFQKNNIKIKHEEFWITSIPDKYKPKDYMKIENGCYW